MPPVELRAPLSTQSERVYSQYEKRFAETDGKRDDNVMDGRHVLTGNHNLNEYLDGISHYVLRHNHPSWSDMVNNPFLGPVARTYGLDAVSWPRMFMLLNRWFFTVCRRSFCH